MPLALNVTVGVPGVAPSTTSAYAKPKLSVLQVTVVVELAGVQAGSPGKAVQSHVAGAGLAVNDTGLLFTGTPY